MIIAIISVIIYLRFMWGDFKKHMKGKPKRHHSDLRYYD